MLPEVFRIGEGRSEWHQRLAALTKWSGGVASHRAAGALFGLDGFDERVLEITSARRLRRPDSSVVVHFTPQLPLDSIPVDCVLTTSPTRTLLDLAAVVDAGVLELSLEDALRRRLTSLPRIRWQLATIGGQGRRGTDALRRLVQRYEPGGEISESAFEVLLHQLLRRAKLPEPRRQFEIRQGSIHLGRADFAYPGPKLIIEAVSFRWHSGRTAWSRDQARWNAVTAAGWRVLNVTWEDLTLHPRELAVRIREALGQGPLF